MLADFFTKPHQGTLLQKFRDVLLGTVHVGSVVPALMMPNEERVGEIRFDPHKTDATVVTNTAEKRTVKGTPHKVTWADIVL
jgi:hypothetical protein